MNKAENKLDMLFRDLNKKNAINYKKLRDAGYSVKQSKRYMVYSNDHVKRLLKSGVKS